MHQARPKHKFLKERDDCTTLTYRKWFTNLSRNILEYAVEKSGISCVYFCDSLHSQNLNSDVETQLVDDFGYDDDELRGLSVTWWRKSVLWAS